MTAENMSISRQSVRTPRAAAIAGILFALLFGISMAIIRLSLPSEQDGPALGEWNLSSLTLAVSLMPYAGIAFLWFVGVVRDHLGAREDKFFATVFLGGGLLFLAMTFSAAAIATAMITTYRIDPVAYARSDINVFARSLISSIFNIFAIRMGGVFMISSGTIWVRSRIMPRWLVFLTYGFALLLLLSISLSLWVSLVFPAWVFVISCYILVVNMRKEKTELQTKAA